MLGLLPGIGIGFDGLSKGHLILAGWSVWLAGTVLVLAAAWTLVQYRLDGTSPGWRVKGLLASLRILAAACLLVILLEPVLSVTSVSTMKQTFIVLADRSRSMSFRDPRLPDRPAQAWRRATRLDPRSARRADLAQAILAGDNVRLLARLAEKFDVRTYAFDDDAHLADLRRPLEPDTREYGSTRIGTALRTALDDNTGAPVAGILIVSDGGSNQGEDPVAWARQARGLGIPVSALGVGDPTPTRDIVVTEALADRFVRKDSEVQVFVGITNRGYGGASATVTLRRNGSAVASKTVKLASDGSKQTVPFTYTPGQVGQFTFTAGVSRQAGETTYENNARSFLQQVMDKKLRVLYVEGEPRWEYRYLRNAVLRDDQIGFACFLTETGGAPAPEGNLPVTAFPTDERQLFTYDIVILGDVPRERLLTTQLRAIRRFVEDRGGSLVIIAGERAMPHAYADTIIEPAFPLVVATTPNHYVMDEPFQWQRTPAGAQDPIMRMHPDPGEDERIWRGLPGMLWMAGSQRPKPGATVLAVNRDRGDAPVVAVQRYGAGRCLMIMSDSTWRWRWKVGDRHFYRFWGQVLRIMTPLDSPGGNRVAAISVDRTEYRPGDRVQVTARLLDEFYRPSRLPQVVAAFARTGAPAQSVTLRPVPGSPGLYAGDLSAPGKGEYRLSLPAGDGRAPATARFIVAPVSLEAERPEMHEDVLRKIARAGGGRLLSPDQLAGWVESLRPEPIIIETTSQMPLWNIPLGLVLVVGLLTLEWMLRRRAGMA